MKIVERTNEQIELEERLTRSLANLVKRANEQDDPEALSTLKELFREAPKIAEHYGGLQRRVEESVLGRLAPATLAACRQEAETVRQALMAEGASPLEQLAIDQIICNWLYALVADLDLHKCARAGSTFELYELHEKRAERAQRRLLRSITALARIRKLLTPTIQQLNLAHQQVNQLNVGS